MSDQYEAALYAIRNAAGSASQFTNRLQFIYERASCALRGEVWDEKWRAEYGYNVREKTMRHNERLADALRLAKAALEQGGSPNTHISANGPTLGEVIEKALRDEK